MACRYERNSKGKITVYAPNGEVSSLYNDILKLPFVANQEEALAYYEHLSKFDQGYAKNQKGEPKLFFSTGKPLPEGVYKISTNFEILFLEAKRDNPLFQVGVLKLEDVQEVDTEGLAKSKASLFPDKVFGRDSSYFFKDAKAFQPISQINKDAKQNDTTGVIMHSMSRNLVSGKEFSNKAHGTFYTTQQEQTLYRGEYGKRNADGSKRSAHKLDMPAAFASASKPTAEKYSTKEFPVKEISIPAGAKVEVVNLFGTKAEISYLRELEVNAIKNSLADIVELNTFDTYGKETQYVIINKKYYEESNRIPPQAEQGRTAGGKLLVEATNFLANYERTNPETPFQTERQYEQEQIEALKEWARERGIYQNEYDFEDSGYLDEMSFLSRGFESRVYVKKESDGYVYKVKTPVRSSAIEMMDSIALHNYLFPETKYELEKIIFGYGEEPIIKLVLKQPFVVGRKAEQFEVYDELTKRGFKLGTYAFSYEGIRVTDVQTTSAVNVIVSDSGNMYFIDPYVFYDQDDTSASFQVESFNKYMEAQSQTPQKVFSGIVEKLKQTGLARNVFTDRDQMINYLRNNKNEKLNFLRTKSGIVYGFTTKEGDVYIDSEINNQELVDVFETQEQFQAFQTNSPITLANTAIHEFGHLYNSWLKNNKPEHFKKGIELVKGTKYEQQVRENPFYKNLSEEQILEEALAIAIGDKGASFVESAKQKSFTQWLSDLWKELSNIIGLSMYSEQQLQDLTLDQYTSAVVSELLGGGKLESNQKTSNKVRITRPTNTNNAFEDMINFSVEGGILEIGKIRGAKNYSVITLEVNESFRRQGKATELLKNALDYTQGKLSSQVSNLNSLKLHYKLGMRFTENQSLSLEDIEKMRKGKAGESVNMMLPSSKTGGNYKSFNNSAFQTEFSERQQIEQTAKQNGTWLKAPNGDKTNLTEQQWVTVRTQAFKNWFGDWQNDPQNASKVVDDNGEPLVVYHGGFAKINIFSSDFGDFTTGNNSQGGFYFSNSEDVAQDYAEQAWVRLLEGGTREDVEYYKDYGLTDLDIEKLYENKEEGESLTESDILEWAEEAGKPSVTAAFLNFRNPIVESYNGKNFDNTKDTNKLKAIKQGFDETGEFYDYMSFDEDTIADYEEEIQEYMDENDAPRDEAVREVLYEAGVYEEFTADGIINTEVVDSIGWKSQFYQNVYIAADPNQIKSATENTGQFSPYNPDIRFSARVDGRQVQIGVINSENTKTPQVVVYADDLITQIAKLELTNTSPVNMDEVISEIESRFGVDIDFDFSDNIITLEDNFGRIDSSSPAASALVEIVNIANEQGLTVAIDPKKNNVEYLETETSFEQNEEGIFIHESKGVNFQDFNAIEGEGFSANLATTRDEFQRNRLGTNMYMIAFEQLGKPIYSGTSVSDAAHNMWNRLVNLGVAKSFMVGDEQRYVLYRSKPIPPPNTQNIYQTIDEMIANGEIEATCKI